METQDLKLVNEGILQMKEGQYQKAESLFNKAIILEGQYLSKAYYNKGVLLQNHLNDIKEAMLCYIEATTLNPDYGYAWHNLGETLLHYNRYNDALQMFITAIETIPEDLNPRIGLAHTFNRLQEYESAIETLEPLLDQQGIKDNHMAKIQSEYGLALLQTNRVPEAYDHFKKAFQLNENDYQVCYNIAFISDMFKNYAEALSFYDKAIAVNTNEAKGYQGKACTYIHMREYQEALPYIQKAIALSPKNFEGYYNLACIHAGLGEEEALLDAIKKTIELAPPQIGIEKHIQKDPDFLPYSKNEGFMSVIEKRI